jgi:hypothetical protein
MPAAASVMLFLRAHATKRYAGYILSRQNDACQRCYGVQRCPLALKQEAGVCRGGVRKMQIDEDS